MKARQVGYWLRFSVEYLEGSDTGCRESTIQLNPYRTLNVRSYNAIFLSGLKATCVLLYAYNNGLIQSDVKRLIVLILLSRIQCLIGRLYVNMLRLRDTSTDTFPASEALVPSSACYIVDGGAAGVFVGELLYGE